VIFNETQNNEKKIFFNKLFSERIEHEFNPNKADKDCVTDNFLNSRNRVLFIDLGYSKSGKAFDKFHGHNVLPKPALF
jgi:hypothetical protein